MEIRQATTSDSEAMRSMWVDSSAELAYTPYPGAAFDDSWIVDLVALVAEVDGEPAGTVYANLVGEQFGFVFGLYVRPDQRRQGLAGELMRAIARVLRDEGRQYLVLSVDTPNAAARALYDGLGFVDAARTLRIEVDAFLAGDS